MSALVAKIGGSLWRSPELAQWIAALRAFRGPLTLVPGGGPFADAVRVAQPAMGFGDDVAHKMALLAMEQYGMALCGAFDGLELASTPQEAAALRAKGKIAVWRPSLMTLAATIPVNWDITSDSLCAFYARESGATRLLLVKSVDTGPDGGRNLVDPCFAPFAEGLEVFIAGPRALASAAEIFAQGDVAGTPAKFGYAPR